MLYIHIPFCKSRCLYCDFFSTVEAELKQQYVDALCREMDERRDEILRARVNTIYIGGGTPSQLTHVQIGQIFQHLESIVPLLETSEITIEVNPDDVTPEFVEHLSATPINRVSMGVQTLNDDILRLLHRRHTSEQAGNAVRLLRKAGYENLSLDLMYGLPRQTMEKWRRDVDTLLSWQIPHLSAYALQWEEGTALWQMLQRGEVCEADEELSLAMYDYLEDTTERAGMLHYEISNFSLPGSESRHNSGYWCEEPYVGLGPGAHSYDGERTRKSNHPNLLSYIKGERKVSAEVLTDSELYDELVMKRLRTKRGLYISEIPTSFRDYALRMAKPHLASGRMVFDAGILRLTRQGIFTSNDIMSDLML